MSHEPETIGPYRLLRRLGAGASGCVFEAEDPAAGRRVALKLLIAGAIQPDTLERFRREREALARVDHPHVLRVHAAGSWQGRPYLVTELLPGRTLSAVLGAGPVGLEAATRYALEVAEGLGALHAAGLIHRDIKPANVLLDEAGACKVADLGLAFCEGDRALTATGTLLGTPTYMSPEALAGKVVRDPSADVYSLGVLFYELLTGRPPHEGHNVFALAHARLEEPAPDPRVHAPGLPRGVAAVCRQALDVDP
ncbi:MAG: serine/threonine protein kinase, partial [Planctomycetota bacterium]|nr:serine/threonine protein kinase [Planctomycetota bacterium]